jgi:hypothetical protein
MRIHGELFSGERQETDNITEGEKDVL